MEKSILLSFELDGTKYELVNNRNVLRNAAKKERKLFDDLLKKDEKAMSFIDIIDEGENNHIIYKTLFAYALLENNDDMLFEAACDIFEVLWYNLDVDTKKTFAEKLMSLLNNEDFIKGSNRRVATIKMNF